MSNLDEKRSYGGQTKNNRNRVVLSPCKAKISLYFATGDEQ